MFQPPRRLTSARLLGPIVAIVGSLLTPSALAAAPARDPIPASDRLELRAQAAIRNSGLRRATIAVSIRDPESGEELVAIDGTRPMLPASNLKLITSGAFLHAFGPDFRFRTRCVLSRDDLAVVGDGDPALADPELLSEMTYTGADGEPAKGLDVEGFIALWTAAAKAKGITAIDEVIVDARIFDAVAYHPHWPSDQYKEDYCAQVWGFNFHHNLLLVWPKPRPGTSAEVTRISPNTPWLVRSNATTSKTGGQDRHTFWINRPPNQNLVSFNGNVKHAATDPIAVSLHDTPSYFARLFAERLRAAGIEVRAWRAASASDPVFEGERIGPEIQTPIETVLYRCNTDSDNLSAECLLKRLGNAATKSPGSWENGCAAVHHAVGERLGDAALTASIRPDDGSGLSRENRITASAMTAWLASFARDSTLGDALLESMALAGKTGTVKNRFKDVERTGCTIRCKTGYIRGVSTLSGYVVGPDGARLSFSVLCNDLVESDAVGKAKSLQEQIALAISEELASRASRRTTLGSD